MARFSASFSALRCALAILWSADSSSGSTVFLIRVASMTASRSRSARSLASWRRVARVERLSAIGWSSGSPEATASGPSTRTAEATERSGADPQGERGHQLRDVHAQYDVARRDLTAAQVGHVQRAGGVHQQRLADQPAVRDPP